MNSNRHNAGFSLVEVLVAILILSVALVGLVRGVTMALASGKESELQTTAGLFAAGLIEELRAEGDIIDGQTDGACGEELPLYRWTETITGAGIDGLHQVDVAVQNARTGQEIYDLRTLLFERPEESGDSKQSPEDRAKRRRSQ
jgi:prepilin-type N-terminal cleavage/methylation domain-containing protein